MLGCISGQSLQLGCGRGLHDRTRSFGSRATHRICTAAEQQPSRSSGPHVLSQRHPFSGGLTWRFTRRSFSASAWFNQQSAETKIEQTAQLTQEDDTLEVLRLAPEVRERVTTAVEDLGGTVRRLSATRRRIQSRRIQSNAIDGVLYCLHISACCCRAMQQQQLPYFSAAYIALLLDSRQQALTFLQVIKLSWVSRRSLWAMSLHVPVSHLSRQSRRCKPWPLMLRAPCRCIPAQPPRHMCHPICKEQYLLCCHSLVSRHKPNHVLTCLWRIDCHSSWRIAMTRCPNVEQQCFNGFRYRTRAMCCMHSLVGSVGP